jgi:branched-subunit amino acid aminotransferase/4-amino-4-deoxychorismate lyase
MTIVMLNGVFTGADEATVPALDTALTHGLGLYETLKLLDGVPAFFAEHMDRLRAGLTAAGLAHPFDDATLADQVVRLSEATGVRNGACRVLVTGGPPEGRPSLLIQTEHRPVPRHPLIVITHHTQRAAAALKSNSFIASHIAKLAAEAAGADDALFVDEDGRIYEATTANVFVWHDGVLTTAPSDGAILPGVVRAAMMKLAAADGIAVVERHARAGDLGAGDVMLLTSSVRGIVPVGLVDGVALRQDARLLGRLRALLGEAETASAAAFVAKYLRRSS